MSNFPRNYIFSEMNDSWDDVKFHIAYTEGAVLGEDIFGSHILYYWKKYYLSGKGNEKLL